jgi:hypothetical protein
MATTIILSGETYAIKHLLPASATWDRATETWRLSSEAWDRVVASYGGERTNKRDRANAAAVAAVTVTRMRESITNEEIEALKTSAGAAGDLVQVAVCEMALGETVSDLDEHDAYRFERLDLDGSQERARAACLAVLADAEGVEVQS